jgi:hypothetical protein
MAYSGEDLPTADVAVITQKSDMNFTDLAQLAQRRYGELFTGTSDFPQMSEAISPAQLYYGLCKAREELWLRYRAANRARLTHERNEGMFFPPSESEERTQQRIYKLTQFINRYLDTLSVP